MTGLELSVERQASARDARLQNRRLKPELKVAGLTIVGLGFGVHGNAKTRLCILSLLFVLCSYPLAMCNKACKVKGRRR